MQPAACGGMRLGHEKACRHLAFPGASHWHEACSFGGQEVRMVPMIDAMMVPGATDAILTVGPAFVGVLVAMIAGAAWVARQTAEELRRTAAREWEARMSLTTGPTHTGRLAA